MNQPLFTLRLKVIRQHIYLGAIAASEPCNCTNVASSGKKGTRAAQEVICYHKYSDWCSKPRQPQFEIAPYALILLIRNGTATGV
jgi:hypothetical protein